MRRFFVDKVESISGSEDIRVIMDKRAGDGWELVQIVPDGPYLWFFWKKES